MVTKKPTDLQKKQLEYIINIKQIVKKGIVV